MKDFASPPLAALRPLFEEIGELKRADFQGRSVASRAFQSAWASLVAGADPATLARQQVAHAIASTVLGGIDDVVMADAGLDRATVHAIRSGTVAQKCAPLGGDLAARLDGAMPATETGTSPAFCALLEGSPRAGVTAPGLPRLILRPAENHAEHCWTVAVYAALVTLYRGADDETTGRAFLIGLAHHFPNAWMPDAGFAGEIALGDSLNAVFNTFTTRALSMLPGPLAARARDALAVKDDVGDPAGAAFVTGDVVDRVLELNYYERAYAFRLSDALGPMDLVHEGPLQGFQKGILVEAGIVT